MSNDRPQRREDVNARVIDGETIVLDRTVNQVHQLNATASFVFERCDGQHTAADITAELLEAFEVDAETAQAAVANTLRQFSEIGLLSSS